MRVVIVKLSVITLVHTTTFDNVVMIKVSRDTKSLKNKDLLHINYTNKYVD